MCEVRNATANTQHACSSRLPTHAHAHARAPQTTQHMHLRFLQSHIQHNASTQGAYLEGLGHIGEVGDAAADDEHAVAAVGLARGQVQHGLRVVIGLLLVGVAAVLAVVAQLGAHVQVRHCVGENHTRATCEHAQEECEQKNGTVTSAQTHAHTSTR